MGRTTGVGKRRQQPCGRVPSRPPRSGLQRARYVLNRPPTGRRSRPRRRTPDRRPPRSRQPEHRGGGPGPHVAQPGAARDDDHEHALHPSAHLVGRVQLQDRLPPHRRRPGRPPRRRPAAARPATAAGRARPRPPPAPTRRSRTSAPAPAGVTRPTQPENSPPTTAPTAIAATASRARTATRRSAGRPAPGTAPWACANDHRDDVHDEGHHQHGLVAMYAQPFDHRRQPGLETAPSGASARQPQRRVERRR